MRNEGVAQAAASAAPSAPSAQASVTAVGLPSATSRAKVGPDRIATGLPGAIWAATSLISRPLTASTPLLATTSGTPSARTGSASASVTRKYCAGVAQTSRSLSRAAWRIADVARIAGSSGTSRRKTGFSWRSLMSRTVAGSFAHSVTSSPARASVCASAVPHAPAPMTAAVLNCFVMRPF